MVCVTKCVLYLNTNNIFDVLLDMYYLFIYAFMHLFCIYSFIL